jgi:hypothetical protein
MTRIRALNLDQSIGAVIPEFEVPAAATRDSNQACAMVIPKTQLEAVTSPRHRSKRAEHEGRLRSVRNEAKLSTACVP